MASLTLTNGTEITNIEILPVGRCKNCGSRPHCGIRSREGQLGISVPGYGKKGRGVGIPDCKYCACPKCRPDLWTAETAAASGYDGVV